VELTSPEAVSVEAGEQATFTLEAQANETATAPLPLEIITDLGGRTWAYLGVNGTQLSTFSTAETAEVQPAQKARQVYDEARQRGDTAGVTHEDAEAYLRERASSDRAQSTSSPVVPAGGREVLRPVSDLLEEGQVGLPFQTGLRQFLTPLLGVKEGASVLPSIPVEENDHLVRIIRGPEGPKAPLPVLRSVGIVGVEVRFPLVEIVDIGLGQ
jgi:hypothetical protein